MSLFLEVKESIKNLPDHSTPSIRNSGNSGRNMAGFSTTLLWCTKKPPQSYLTKNTTPEVPQIPYSPAFSPVNLFLFPKWKVSLEGLKFHSAKEI
jgi:hypothetical protein